MPSLLTLTLPGDGPGSGEGAVGKGQIPAAWEGWGRPVIRRAELL